VTRPSEGPTTDGHLSRRYRSSNILRATLDQGFAGLEGAGAVGGAPTMSV